MEDAKKMEEATKPEELAERVELTDEELDQASGGAIFRVVAKNPSDQTILVERLAVSWNGGIGLQ